MNRKPGRQTDTYRQTYRQTDRGEFRQTKRDADRQTHKQTDRRTERHTDRQKVKTGRWTDMFGRTVKHTDGQREIQIDTEGQPDREIDRHRQARQDDHRNPRCLAQFAMFAEKVTGDRSPEAEFN